jgi:ABC-type Zn uptake system ZnuABC Zn-binding protein ZnuA
VLPEDQYIYDFSFPKEDGKPNPHLWTDPTFAIRYAEVIRDAFSRKDPANAGVYADNTQRFTAQVTQLSDALRADQTSVERRELLTYHDAYAYFGRNYGWNILGAIQPASFEEPAPAEVARLIDQIRAERVPAIFGSEVFPSPVLEQIGRETGARYVDTLRDDDLPGVPGAAEHSWQGLMRLNYVTMITALGGRADRLQALSLAPPVPDTADYPQ